MADLTMCTNDECPLASNCYRHEATPSEYRQSYFRASPDGDTCKYYWPMKEEGDTHVHRKNL